MSEIVCGLNVLKVKDGTELFRIQIGAIRFVEESKRSVSHNLKTIYIDEKNLCRAKGLKLLRQERSNEIHDEVTAMKRMR